MSQAEILEYLKSNKTKWVTIQDLVVHFGVRQQNLSRKVKKLNECGYLEIIVDGRRRLIKFKENKITIRKG